MPEGSLLILDEAYGEFAPAGTLPPFDMDNCRVIRLRTFSKAYGLAGMRVGYAIGNEELIAEFNKVRNHFGLSRLSQIAALAAVQDQRTSESGSATSPGIFTTHPANCRGQSIEAIADCS